MSLEIRRCEQCNQKYYVKTKHQKLCQDPCRSKGKLSLEEANAAWVKRGKKKYKLNHLKDYNW